VSLEESCKEIISSGTVPKFSRILLILFSIFFCMFNTFFPVLISYMFHSFTSLNLKVLKQLHFSSGPRLTQWNLTRNGMVVNVKQFFNNFVRVDSHYMISAFDFFYETMWTVTHRLFYLSTISISYDFSVF
jgi:hypothetical protein